MPKSLYFTQARDKSQFSTIRKGRKPQLMSEEPENKTLANQQISTEGGLASHGFKYIVAHAERQRGKKQRSRLTATQNIGPCQGSPEHKE